MRELRGQYEAEQRGFSVGGEFGSAVTFLVEHGGERRGYSASWQWATIGMTSIIAAASPIVAKPGVTTISVVPISISPIERVSPALRPAR